MPWISEQDCVNCGICVDECPAGAIREEAGKIQIFMEDCIRCGICHDVCPQEAVRHDGEKIPEMVEDNIEWILEHVQKSRSHFDSDEAGLECLQKHLNHFNKNIKIAEKTIARIEELKQSYQDNM